MADRRPWGRPRSRRRPWPFLLGLGIAVAALVAALAVAFPEIPGDDGDPARMVERLVILAVVASAAIVYWRARPGLALAGAATWIGIGLALLVGYSFRDEAAALGRRLLGELVPHRGVAEGDTVVVRADRSGHFVVEALVDGAPVRFLVDTGASDVVLGPADARRVGLAPPPSAFTRSYRTAGGVVMGAPVTLGRVAIGPVALEGVRAAVSEAETGRSLLGMSFLSRLSGYEVAGARLTLRR